MTTEVINQWWCAENDRVTLPWMSVYHACRIAGYAREATKILEYGAGGSTLWLAQIASGASIVSIEYDPDWAEWAGHAMGALRRSGVKLADLEIIMPNREPWSPSSEYDLAIVDGPMDKRCDQFREAWDRAVIPGGVIALHDSQDRRYDSLLKAYEAYAVFDDRAHRSPSLWIGRLPC